MKLFIVMVGGVSVICVIVVIVESSLGLGVVFFVFIVVW